MASTLTIVEVDELVDVGEIDPEMIVTPGVFIDRIVKIPEGEVGSANQKKNLIKILLEDETVRRVMLSSGKKGN